MEDCKPFVELHIPDAEDFEDGYSTIAVPYLVVTGTIDVLQAMIAQWQRDDGCEPDDELWGHLMRAAGLALGGLVAAYAGARSAQGRASKEKMREHVARNLELTKQWKERWQQERMQQPPAPAQQPASKDDPGWGF
jgi:hypothetical protein